MSVHGPVGAGSDNTVALTEADGSHGEGPVLLGLGAEGWVYVGLTIFILLAIFVGKAPRRITDILDQRIADTRRALDEAKQLRTEAEALLTEARKRDAASAGDARAIVAHAEAEAQVLLAKAAEDAENLVRRRAQMAQDKIGAAERAAIAEVRAYAVDSAVKAATALIGAKLGAAGDKALIDKTIAGLGRPN